MANIKFTLDGDTWSASCPRNLPVNDPIKVNVAVDYSEGGQLYAYEKGPAEKFFNLDFKGRLVTADQTALLDWFENISVGVLNVFTFTDEDGTDNSVRWMDETYPLREFKDGFFAGVIRLRKEI